MKAAPLSALKVFDRIDIGRHVIKHDAKRGYDCVLVFAIAYQSPTGQHY